MSVGICKRGDTNFSGDMRVPSRNASLKAGSRKEVTKGRGGTKRYGEKGRVDESIGSWLDGYELNVDDDERASFLGGSREPLGELKSLFAVFSLHPSCVSVGRKHMHVCICCRNQKGRNRGYNHAWERELIHVTDLSQDLISCRRFRVPKSNLYKILFLSDNIVVLDHQFLTYSLCSVFYLFLSCPRLLTPSFFRFLRAHSLRSRRATTSSATSVLLSL